MSFIPGANVGPYRIVEQAERVGIATAYTAYQPAQGRYVSVVVVPSIDRDDVALQRQYQRQIDLALSLRHPNVLTVLDHGEHLGVSFIVTELLEAEPLSERLGAPWPLPEVVRILKPIAAALDFAHGYGLVHGEMRPSLILVSPDGTPILSGFGQSTRRFADADGVPVTLEPGQRTPSIPAEIARAQAADRRGLALIAYEMLTGRSVHVSASEYERPLSPTLLGSPLLTPPVERALLRELSSPTTERYPSASAFMEDLGASVALPTSLVGSRDQPPAEPIAPLPPPGGESRRRLMTVAIIFTALAVLGSLALLLRGGEPSRPIGAARTPGIEVTPGVTVVASDPSAGSTPVPNSATAAGAVAGSAVATGTEAPPIVTAGAATGAASAVVSVTPTRSPQRQVLVPSPAVVDAPLPTRLPTITPRAASAGAAAAGAATSVSTRIPVAWRVTGDPSGRWTHDEQGRVAASADEGASLLLFPETVEDVSYSALVSTSSCQATLVFRAQDDENLLMAIYIPDGVPNPTSTGGGIWLYQRVEGLDVPIRAVRPSTMGRAGEPVRMKIETKGPQITVSLDGEVALQAVDTAPKPGKLGLMIYSAAGSQCEATFDDIQR